jgi:plasmid replication initiation protein
VDERTPWATFRKKHLRPAVDEIHAMTELSVNYRPKRKGGRDRQRGEVESVLFQLAERKSMTRKRKRESGQGTA